MNSLNNIQKNHSNKIISSFFLIILIIGCFTFTDYGISIDEEFQRSSGYYWLSYVLDFTSFNNLATEVQNKYNDIKSFTLLSPEIISFYGVIFDLPLALIETLFNVENSRNYFFLRHLINFLIFFISSIFFYKLLLNRFNNFYVGFIGTIFYVLSPRIYGSSFYNNKDTLFLSLVTIALYYCFKSLDNLNYKNIIIFSIISAICTSTRIIGIFIPVSFLLIFLMSKTSGKTNYKTIYKILFYIILYYFFLVIHWPFLWEAPIKNFIWLITSTDQFLIKMEVMFSGNYFKSNLLPFSYLPTWIIISTPVIHLIFFFLGSFYVFRRILIRFTNIKENNNFSDFWRGNNEKKDFYIFFSFLICFIYLIFIHKTFFNGWRHSYFLNIFLVYFSTYGFYLVYNNIKIIKKKIMLLLLVLLMTFFLAGRMLIYHPYQNIYFNFLVTDVMKQGFDIDYNGLSGIDFLQKILVNYDNKKINIAVASYLPLERSLALLKESDKKKINIVGQEYAIADYIFSNNISEVNKKLNNKYKIPNNFTKIDELIIDDAKVYNVYRRN